MIPHSRSRVVFFAIGALVALAPALTATADDFKEEFHQTYALSAQGTFGIGNINGDVRIAGWDRNEVKVDAVKTADSKERLDQLKIEVAASSDRVTIKTKYPENRGSWGKNHRAAVEYIITIPYSARVDEVELVNGNLTIEGIQGAVKANTVNGRISSMKLGGAVELSTVNGRIEASLGKAEPSKTVKLETVNGAVQLALPANSAASIKASTVNGNITNEFSLPMVKGRFVGRSLEGQIGSGGADVHINTVNGRISIIKTSDA